MKNKYPIPIEVFNQHTVVLGKTGAGKSYGLCGIVEMLLDHHKRVCIADPKGDWWGLKSSADGKSAGYGVILFGDFKKPGKSDIPINAHSGKEIAELVATGNRPCVIGFRGWMPTDRTRFWIDFASTLFNLNNSELYLVCDEVHNFAPQGKVLDPDAGKCLHWTNRIATEGRGNGIRFMMASQRPQKVHKDTLTCAETLIAMRVIHKLDRDAYQDWIDGCGDPERGRTVISTIAEIQRGEAFVWSPELQYFERLIFPAIKSFDSFQTPKGDEAMASPKGWKEVDLEEIKAKLQRTIDEAKRTDHKELQKKVLQLELELRKVNMSNPLPPIKEKEIIKEIDKPILKEKQLERLEKLFDRMQELSMEVGSKLDIIRVYSMDKKPVITQRLPSIKQPVIGQPKRDMAPKSEIEGDIKLGRCERAILIVLAQYPEGRSRVQVSILAGYSSTGGGFSNSIGYCNTQGLLIKRGDSLYITPKGFQVLGDYDPLPTGEELQKYWLAKLGLCERTILKYLCSMHPAVISKETIAEENHYSVNGGGFNNSIGKLNTLELIIKTPDGIQASDTLCQN